MIETTNHGKVRELRLARPPANAFNPALVVELTRRVEEAPEQGVDALVVSGAPGMFTGGLDVPELLALGKDDIRAFWRSFYAMLRTVAASPIPVAVAITGHCPAAGAVLSVFCDRRVMAEGNFKIGMNEVQVGLVVPPTLQYAMKRLTGPRVGDALLVAGALVTPAEALRVGLVDEVVALDAVVPTTLAWAERMVALPRDAMRETRRIALADLVAQFAGLGEGEVDAAASRWFTDETQTTLRALVARLGKSS
ncbi:MAG: enoyl-CoA hydratase/isomerase family protein [Gemmatimonadetes bacterium]|nr:enoyl-CoA hydratase/isomerase family protein [Gemmatimonadota bacterium]